ncbi:MAG TPA: hypothetical protein VF179_18035 [Thermoanaerobaculia bacterium]|nr:hypothetical protein [Thermoanaerobaculia bacterium]
MDRHGHGDQSSGPQLAERGKQEAEMGQEGEPERDADGVMLQPEQRAGRPRRGSQDRERRQMDQ